MTTALAVSLLLVASVLWIEAHERRAAFARVRSSAAARRSLKAGGWLLSGAALFVLAAPLGWERGIPAWFGWLSLAGFAALLFSARFPGRHPVVGAVGLAGVIVLGAGLLLGGGR